MLRPEHVTCTEHVALAAVATHSRRSASAEHVSAAHRTIGPGLCMCVKWSFQAQTSVNANREDVPVWQIISAGILGSQYGRHENVVCIVYMLEPVCKTAQFTN